MKNWLEYVTSLWAAEPVEEDQPKPRINHFVFAYTLHGETRHIVVSIDEPIIAEAEKYGVDLTRVESETKEAIDGVFHKITASSFWHRAMTVADMLQIPYKEKSPPGDTNDRVQTG